LLAVIEKRRFLSVGRGHLCDVSLSLPATGGTAWYFGGHVDPGATRFEFEKVRPAIPDLSTAAHDPKRP
jgi:hypothetical protein